MQKQHRPGSSSSRQPVATAFSHTLSEPRCLVSGPPAIVWSLTDLLGVLCLLFKLARQVPTPVPPPRLQDRQSGGKIHPPCSDAGSANTWHAGQTSRSEPRLCLCSLKPPKPDPALPPAPPQPGWAGRGSGSDVVVEASQKGRVDA